MYTHTQVSHCSHQRMNIRPNSKHNSHSTTWRSWGRLNSTKECRVPNCKPPLQSIDIYFPKIHLRDTFSPGQRRFPAFRGEWWSGLWARESSAMCLHRTSAMTDTGEVDRLPKSSGPQLSVLWTTDHNAGSLQSRWVGGTRRYSRASWLKERTIFIFHCALQYCLGDWLMIRVAFLEHSLPSCFNCLGRTSPKQELWVHLVRYHVSLERVFPGMLLCLQH